MHLGYWTESIIYYTNTWFVNLNDNVKKIKLHVMFPLSKTKKISKQSHLLRGSRVLKNTATNIKFNNQVKENYQKQNTWVITRTRYDKLNIPLPTFIIFMKTWKSKQIWIIRSLILSVVIRAQKSKQTLYVHFKTHKGKY